MFGVARSVFASLIALRNIIVQSRKAWLAIIQINQFCRISSKPEIHRGELPLQSIQQGEAQEEAASRQRRKRRARRHPTAWLREQAKTQRIC
tara:strand:+ start:421 stop:696 length:276 start_codon:yes stop_codon:yes gene_type:complete